MWDRHSSLSIERFEKAMVMITTIVNYAL